MKIIFHFFFFIGVLFNVICTCVSLVGIKDRNMHMYNLILGFPCGSTGKESTYSAGDVGSIPGLGKSPEEGKGYLLQYSGLENAMDCIVRGVTKSWTGLGD